MENDKTMEFPSHFVQHVKNVLQDTKTVSKDDVSFDFARLASSFGNLLASLKMYPFSLHKKLLNLDEKKRRNVKELIGDHDPSNGMLMADVYGVWIMCKKKNNRMVNAEQTDIDIPRMLYQTGACVYLCGSVFLSCMLIWNSKGNIKISSRSRGVLTLKKITIQCGYVVPSLKSKFQNPLIMIMTGRNDRELDIESVFPFVDAVNHPRYGTTWIAAETIEGINFRAQLTPAMFGMADKDIVVTFPEEDGGEDDLYAYNDVVDVVSCDDTAFVFGDMCAFIELYKKDLDTMTKYMPASGAARDSRAKI